MPDLDLRWPDQLTLDDVDALAELDDPDAYATPRIVRWGKWGRSITLFESYAAWAHEPDEPY